MRKRKKPSVARRNKRSTQLVPFLPPELMLEIFGHMDGATLRLCRPICRQWLQLICDYGGRLWKGVFERMDMPIFFTRDTAALDPIAWREFYPNIGKCGRIPRESYEWLCRASEKWLTQDGTILGGAPHGHWLGRCAGWDDGHQFLIALGSWVDGWPDGYQRHRGVGGGSLFEGQCVKGRPVAGLLRDCPCLPKILDYYGEVDYHHLPHGKGRIQFRGYGPSASFTSSWIHGVPQDFSLVDDGSDTSVVFRTFVVDPSPHHGRRPAFYIGTGMCFPENKFRPDGRGLMMYDDKSTYDGQWRQGLKCGQGKEFWASGDHYEGEWKDSFRHGRGRYTYAMTPYGNDCVAFDGLWERGDETEGSLLFRNGRVHTGTFKAGLPHGHGVVTFPDTDNPLGAERYEGTWVAGKADNGHLCCSVRLI